MSDPTTPPRSYVEEAAAQDIYLDRKLADIRARQAAGDITTRQAADLRVEALEHHLEAVRYLRREFFGNGDQT